MRDVVRAGPGLNGATDRAKLAGRFVAGKYFLDAYIGSGSCGVVYRARHSVLEKPVALKILDPELAGSPLMVELFKREAKAASRLDHPNSVRILDFGADVSGLLYIAMEFVEGPDLRQLLDEEFPLAEERIVSIMSQMLGALAQAHELGVVHRDLKPENIVVLRGVTDDGQPADIVKVCDFGVAQLSPVALPALPLPRSRLPHPTVVDTNVLVGTPEYMSPEQARGEMLDALSDVYAAGVVLFQLLTSRLPFAAADVGDIAMLQCYAPPPRPSELAEVSAPLEAICLKAMNKNPAQRYQSAREMRAALRQVAAIEHAQTLRPVLSPVTRRPQVASTALVTRAEAHTRPTRGTRRRAMALALSMFALGPAAAAAAYLFPPGSLHDVVRRFSLRGKASIVDTFYAPQATASAAESADKRAEAAPSFAQLAQAVVQPDTPEPELDALQTRDRSARALRADTSSRRTNVRPAERLRDDADGVAGTTVSGGARGTGAEAELALSEPATSEAKQPAGAESVLQIVPLAESEHSAAEVPDPPPASMPPRSQPQLAGPAPLRASMRIKDVTVRGSLATSVVERAISRVESQFSACYDQRAKAAGRNGYGTIRVEVELDERGRTRTAHAHGEVLPGLDRCLTAVAGRLVARRPPDTGTVKAGFGVAFEP